ncbi:hypothetical protein K431DRAFT_286549 [Polychaeton citri CBS 116435]|uniref:Heterokaryon incompatibility domain-containing protein n=1 Tax=Polychaeton citri CBS 116435 TaxID=1314669 RepID=A0A9P4UNN1_9PEZI|nr:hypothetical protein K431DRAFT_286549 [Polychaeton citri CBS 116435]
MAAPDYRRWILANPRTHSPAHSSALLWTMPLLYAMTFRRYRMFGALLAGAVLSSSGEGPLLVTTNLSIALTTLRHPARTRRLWIDAICINQVDIMEKSIQVQLMTNIRVAAKRVIVWLGPSTKHSKVGMEVMGHFARAEPFNRSAIWQALPSEIVSLGLTDIMQRQWSKRYRVVQEAAIAKETMMACGPYRLSWTNACDNIVAFLRSAKLAVTPPRWQQAGFDAIDMDPLMDVLAMQLDSGLQSSVWLKRRRRPGLLEYAYSMRHRQAVDVRDRLYSPIGLVTKSTAVQLVPEYKETAEEVYEEFTQVMMGETSSICAEIASLELRAEIISNKTLNVGT